TALTLRKISRREILVFVVRWTGRWLRRRNGVVETFFAELRINACAEIRLLAAVAGVAAHFAQRLLLIAGILNGETRKRIGDDVAVMQALHFRISTEVKPQ